MLKQFLIFLFILQMNLIQAQTALNVELFSQFNRGDSRYSGSWVYIDDAGNEYALLGTRTGTAAYAIDNVVTEESGFVSGPESNWREITVVGHHAYVTTEGSSDTTGLQIIDLQYLPDSLHLATTYDATFTRGHILQRDVYSDAPYIYVNGTQETDGVHILDISDPENPVEVGLYAPGYYIHDCFVKGDLLFAAAFFESKMDILDISDRTNPVLLTQLDHFDGNTHSSWMTEDDRFLMVASELDGKPSRMYNIEDINNISEVARYTANSLSLVHNPYIRDQYAFISHNTEGLRIVDLYDPEVPVEVAYFDTWDGDSGGFHGLWSACPFLPSGKVIGGNREDGLYVWTFNNAKAGRIYGSVLDSLTQTPFTNLTLSVLETGESLQTDFNGQFKWGALPGTYTFLIEAEGYESRLYSAELAACDSLVVDILLKLDTPDRTNDLYKNLSELSVSPNPSTGKISLDLAGWERGEMIEVYNALGQKVISESVKNSPILELDLSIFAKGTFYLFLLDQEGQGIARNRLVLVQE